MLNTATVALRAIPTKFLSLENWKTACGAARFAGVTYDNFYQWSDGIPDTAIKAWGPTDFVDERLPEIGADVTQGWELLPDAEVDFLYLMADRAGDWPGHWRSDQGLSAVLELAQRYDPSMHQYLEDKPGFPLDDIGVLPEQCCEVKTRIAGRQAGGCLVIPMRDADGELVNLHFAPPRSIADLNDGVTSVNSVPLLAYEGGWFTFGAPPTEGAVFVCESLESAWACWRATGATSVASSLPFDHADCFVVGDLQRAYPSAALVLVATPRTAEFAHDLISDHKGVAVLSFSKESPDFSAFEMLKRDGRAVLKKLLEQATPAPAVGPRFALLTGSDLAATKPSEWAVNSVLPASGLAAIFGLSGVGKSFFALDVVAAIAEGREWFGHSTTPRPIVYAVLEGQAGFKQRVQAWEHQHGRKLPQSVRLMMTSFNISNEQDVAEFAEVLPKGGVLVVDTLNSAATGIDENGSVGMGSILAGAKRLAHLTGGLVLLIHHSGKNEGAGLRGHSSLISALDTAIFVSRKAGRCTWTTNLDKGGKSKDGAGVTHQFTLDTLKLPDGTTSCVIAPDTDNAEPSVAPRLRNALQAFDRVAALEGDGVSLEAWREQFYTTSTSPTPHGKKLAFQRVRNDLVKTGYLQLVGDLYHQTTGELKSPISNGSTAQGGSNGTVSR
jgi:putative DNA primase/helicase